MIFFIYVCLAEEKFFARSSKSEDLPMFNENDDDALKILEDNENLFKVADHDMTMETILLVCIIGTL